MTAVNTQPDIARQESTPNQNLLLEHLGEEHFPQTEQPGAGLLGSILRGMILLTFAGGAGILLVFSLMPAVFVTLLLLGFALSPVILLGLAIVFTKDLRRDDNMADTSDLPCSCHHDRMERMFSKR